MQKYNAVVNNYGKIQLKSNVPWNAKIINDI